MKVKQALPLNSLMNNQLVLPSKDGTLCNCFMDEHDREVRVPCSKTDANGKPWKHPSDWTKVLTDKSISFKMAGEVTLDEFSMTKISKDDGILGSALKALDEQRCQMRSKRTGVPVTSRLSVVDDAFYRISKRTDSSGNRTKILDTRHYEDTGKTVTYMTVSIPIDNEPDLVEC